MATIRNCNTAQAQQIRDCLGEIKKRLETAPIPEAKRRRLIERINTSAVFHCGGPHCRTGIAGYTDSAGSPNIHICHPTFGMRELRLCAVIFHELVHSCGSEELEAEIIENLIFPPDEGGVGKGGGTWPNGDCADFCAYSRLRPDGLRESDFYIWNPKTGQVWEKTSSGDPGRQIWDDPAILARWRCECPRREGGSEHSSGPLIDPIEPGSFPEGMGPGNDAILGETEPASGVSDEFPGHVLVDPIEPGSFPGEFSSDDPSERLKSLEVKIEEIKQAVTDMQKVIKPASRKS